MTRELIISAQVTRPEPGWWMSHCATEDDKRERFLEACRHLPRPLIVYTTLHIVRPVHERADGTVLAATGPG